MRHPFGDAVYEQCPWDQAHVEAIYPILKGLLVADGEWHPTESGAEPWVGRYRIVDGYFQAVFAEEPNPVFAALLAVRPFARPDDAEWDVWAHEPTGGFALSNTFCITPGPFDHQDELVDWLARHGLGLTEHEWYVQGYALIEQLTTEALAEAVDRLTWLEVTLADLNEKLDRAGAAFWQGVQGQVAARGSAAPLRASEWFPGFEPKRRVALSELPPQTPE